MREITTDEQLRACCEEWQQRLRLQDWAVTVKFVDRWRIDPSQAQIEWCRWKKAANISVGRPGQYDPSECEHGDVERFVVHELLHLHLFPWEPEGEGVEEKLQEHAIVCLAEALVGLKRQASIGHEEGEE